MNDVIEKYIHNVKKELYHLVPSAEYIADLRSNLEEYVQQFENCTYQQLIEQFGAPEDVAAEFISIHKPNGPKEQAKFRRRKLLFITLIVALFLLLSFVIFTSSRDRQAFYSDVVTETEEEVITE